MNPPDAGRHGKHCPPPTLTGPLYPQQLFHCHRIMSLPVAQQLTPLDGWYQTTL